MDSDVSTVVDIENGESSNGADPVRDCGGSVADSLTSPRTPNPAAVSSAPPATSHVNLYTIEAILGLSSGQSHCLNSQFEWQIGRFIKVAGSNRRICIMPDDSH